MTSTPKVACVLVNWNGWQDTVDCLDALKLNDYPNLKIIVVDNGSTNDSVSRIRASHPDILLLESSKNLGFAGGNNIGMRYALSDKAEYIWLLNNDTKPAQDSLSRLVAKARTDPKIAAVASVCYYADNPSTVQVWAGAKVNLWIGYARNFTEPQSDQSLDALYGASMLIARPALEQVGLLDEGFFHYWEETEFSVRLRNAGWRLAAAPESRILHKVGASTGGYNPVLDRYFTTSGLRILRLHSKIPHFAMLWFLTVRLATRAVRFKVTQCRSVYAGVQDYLRSLPIQLKIR
ncbi:glycosyltransferase family 2 protein [Edaphobacter sp. HDX4]|uniref:glycosyltransferase family 2 protein n=1 Tax=Edaphobacter sp. HDX4 TaxID=2794064 RepID=UPI002FE60C72